MAFSSVAWGLQPSPLSQFRVHPPLIARSNQTNSRGASRLSRSSRLGHRSYQHGSARHSANPRNTRSARSSRITTASVTRPRRSRTLPAASWFDPRRGGRFHQDPGQWRPDRVRGQRADRDPRGRVEAIVLDDHDRFGLSGMGTPNRGNVDVSPPHSADSGSLEPPQSDRSTVTVPATLAPGRCGVAHRTPSTTVPIPIPLSVTVPARCHAPI